MYWFHVYVSLTYMAQKRRPKLKVARKPPIVAQSDKIDQSDEADLVHLTLGNPLVPFKFKMYLSDMRRRYRVGLATE